MVGLGIEPQFPEHVHVLNTIEDWNGNHEQNLVALCIDHSGLFDPERLRQ
jgi:hypothetical protein